MASLSTLLTELYAAELLFRIATYSQVSVCAFVLYDWCLTLHREAKVFWQVPRTIAAGLYHAIRWSTAFNAIMAVATFSSYSVTSWNIIDKASLISVIIQQLSSAIFSTLRAHALSQRRSVSAAVMLLSLSPVCNSLAQYVLTPNRTAFSKLGCLPGTTTGLSSPANVTMLAVTRTCLITADVVLIVVTWRATSTRGRRLDPNTRSTAISSMIFRDGIKYFIALMLLNITDMVVGTYFDSQLSDALYRPTLVGFGLFAGVFTFPTASVLTSRFLLDLQEASGKACKLGDMDSPCTDSSTCTSSVSLAFARAAASIGSRIDPYAVEQDMSAYFGNEAEAKRDGDAIDV